MYYRTPSVRDQRFEVGLEASFTEPDGVSGAAQRVDPSAATSITGYSGGGFRGGTSSLVFGLCRSPLALAFVHEPAYSGHSARKIVRLCGLQRLLLTGRAQQSTFHQFAMERLKIAFRFDYAPVDQCLFKPL
jgi:hypothetical protein